MKSRTGDPFIGITCDVRIPKEGRQAYALECDHRYPEAVQRAGGYPVLLPIVRKTAVIRRHLDNIDGLVIVGGADVDPKLYGERRRRGTGVVFRPRFLYERKLFAAARARRLPVLGICYGMQLMNVLEGGTLFQDIARDAGSDLRHNDRTSPYHRVTLSSGSSLRKHLGRKRFVVHSHHHQSVARAAPGFDIVATAPDGVIEAVECPSRNLYAVQWHPERTLGSPVSLRLFRMFVNLCR